MSITGTDTEIVPGYSVIICHLQSVLELDRMSQTVQNFPPNLPVTTMQSNLSHGHQSSACELIPVATANEPQISAMSVSQETQHRTRTPKKSNQICRFYGTKKGCRAQDQCPYRHVQKASQLLDSEQASSQIANLGNLEVPDTTSSVASQQGVSKQTSNVIRKAVIAKPVSSLQQRNPREFQLNQIVRRYSPSREETVDGTRLQFKLSPSDPDFPFELEALECILTIPLTYPINGPPLLQVANKEIPRDFQINIERGFDSLRTGSSDRTLLQILNDLDRNLERFLSSEKAQTIKIVANRGTKQEKELPPTIKSTVPDDASVTPAPSCTPALQQRSWTAQQKADAKVKRQCEIRQLEARMGRVPLFSSSKDGVTFNVPLQIPKPKRLPLEMQSLKAATLVVPHTYDLEPCRIHLQGVTGSEVLNVELAFEKRAAEQRDLALMAHINYLTQNIHLMAAPVAISPANHEPLPPAIVDTEVAEVQMPPALAEEGVADQGRPHLRFVPHPPPEWHQGEANDESSDNETTDEYYSEGDSSVISDEASSQRGGVSVPLSTPSTTLEKGVLLSFPQMELHGIELLQLCDISLSVKCDRCKDTTDVKNIKAAEQTTTSIRTISCNKCASPLSISYRCEMMHVNSVKAGYLDLEGCTVVDMLPSRFLPTCSECSTTYPWPGIVSVRGESQAAVCRECHHRVNFKIPEVKFLRVSSNDARIALPLRSKRKKEELGISAGSELPDRGRCKHYSKSYRWFRFSCCNRVYPCDRCHDEKEEHPNEHANRMICGWCSREQNYRPEDCHACGRSVIRRTGGGFWEGGKGTRDKTKMSRKDPRKFKRIGGGTKGGEK